MTTHETKTDGTRFKMLSTQPGVRHGEIHPVVFAKDKTYDLDASLRDQFLTLDAIEPSTEEPVQPRAHGDTPANDPNFGWVEKEPLNENVLEEDPAALRHAELPMEAIRAQNDAAQANGDMTEAMAVSLGRAAPPVAETPSVDTSKAPKAKKGK